MQKHIIAIYLLVTLLVINEVTGHDAMLRPPSKPDYFQNPKQLRRYLKELNDFYAIVGRPRFGKRGYETDYFSSGGADKGYGRMSEDDGYQY
ncbi:pro-neuropeptide Y-like isoform X1 [Mytilus californianus]|uniref:pro-neuropeptide Y-like isoform X1 n=1 Tax=Mytilus californianus TaxID=6549 RepID=UPI002247B3EE|nr:pro-neuropeptide Y-like isoform X1 [Mytilus californianus]